MAAIDSLGFDKRISVPGNHDCDPQVEEIVTLFRYWGKDPDIREKFWSADSELRRLVEFAFSSYVMTWSVRLPAVKFGVLPGDFSYSFDHGSRRIGIVGLNSAFSQIGIFVPSAILDPMQLDSVTNGNPSQWAEEHDVRILMTHHSASSLDRAVQGAFFTQIAPPGRFHLHFCGGRNLTKVELVTKEQHAVVVRGIEEGYVEGLLDLAHPEKSQIRERWYDRRTSMFRDQIRSLSIELPLKKYVQSVTELSPVAAPSVTLVELNLQDFRCFPELKLSFRHESRLSGNWTCLAGINGSGKSSIVEALAAVFLGDPLLRELGGRRLDKLRRIEGTMRHPAEVSATFADSAGSRHKITLRIGEDGQLSSDANSLSFWKDMRSRVCLGFGATRNLTGTADQRSESLSPEVNWQMTIFYPLEKMVAAETAFNNRTIDPAFFVLFSKLLESLFGEEFRVKDLAGAIRFSASAGAMVEASDLPDGYRSTAAWLGQLCAVWTAKFPDLARKGDPALIDGIVLIDEIDLHLHPSLQRTLIPKLRATLPRVQFIVTTHSPMVLLNFDSNEIIALENGERRMLDRQILGFSADQVYQWLMGTDPTGGAMEGEIQDPTKSRQEIAQLLMTSPSVRDEEAKKKVQKLQDRLSRLKL